VTVQYELLVIFGVWYTSQPLDVFRFDVYQLDIFASINCDTAGDLQMFSDATIDTDNNN